MSKRKPFLNYDSPTALLSVVFVMCLHVFPFLSELGNYVSSFVVERIAVSYYDFVLFCFLSHISNTYVSQTFCVVVFKLVPYISIGANISFFLSDLNYLLACNRNKFHLVEAFVVSNNVDIF